MSTTTAVEIFSVPSDAAMPVERGFANREIRVTQIEGEPWFVAKDVTDALGIASASSALQYLDDDEKSQVSAALLTKEGGGFGPQTYSIINESGLYSLILRSRKPEAKAFKKWITSEVLPTIRKTGGAYIKPGSQADLDLSDPDTALAKLAEVVAIAQESRAYAAKLEAQAKADAPLVEASKQLFDYSGGDLHTTTDVARMLNIPPYTFRAYLREWNWITEIGTAARAYAVNQGYMENKVFILPESGRAQNTGKLTRKGIERAAVKLHATGVWTNAKVLESSSV
ncbi:antirepressor [Mycobacterium phage Superchunk]|nr:antirepressor [Mycobacterium phage Superchunk]